jgi:hypothetical protein
MTTETVSTDVARTYTPTVPPPRTRWFAPPQRLHWGAIFGGAIAALALWAMLNALGLAFGLTAIDPSDESLRGVGIFTGIWSIVAPLVALFIGGLVAGHGAGAGTSGDGALHGLVMWGLATVAGFFLVTRLVTTAAGGAAAMTSEIGGAFVGSGPEVAARFGIDADDALGPVNARLRAAGRPEVTAYELRSATRDVVQRAVQTGRLDRDMIVTALVERTDLTRADAEAVAARVDAQFAAAKARLRESAVASARSAGMVSWGIFGMLAVGLCAAITGAALGVTRRQRAWAYGAVSLPPMQPYYPTAPSSVPPPLTTPYVPPRPGDVVATVP